MIFKPPKRDFVQDQFSPGSQGRLSCLERFKSYSNTFRPNWYHLVAKHAFAVAISECAELPLDTLRNKLDASIGAVFQTTHGENERYLKPLGVCSRDHSRIGDSSQPDGGRKLFPNSGVT